MKVYFINLDRSPERREWYFAQAARLGLDAVRIDAVDARLTDAAELDRWRALSSGLNSLSAGEIGCFLSHRKIWQAVLDGDDEWAFASEDDLHLADDAARFINSSDWIPAEAEMIKAETNLLQEIELSHAVRGRPFGRELRRLRSHHFGSGGYFVSKAAARHLLAFTERHCEPLDVILFSPQFGVSASLDVLQLSPAICLQDVFVAEHADSSALASVIAGQRADFHQSNPQRARGAAKLKREMKRLGRQIARPFRKAYLGATRQAVFQVVPAELRTGVLQTRLPQ